VRLSREHGDVLGGAESVKITADEGTSLKPSCISTENCFACPKAEEDEQLRGEESAGA